MDTDSEFDERVAAKAKEVMQEGQQQLLHEMNGLKDLIQKLSDQSSVSNEEQLQKITTIVATGEMPKFKRKSNEEQFKVNSKVIIKLDEAEQSADSMNADKTKEKIIEGKR